MTPLTDAEIAELRNLHEGVIAQDTGWAVSNGVPIYPENIAFMVDCNNKMSRLLDEVTRSRALLKRIEWSGAGQGLVYRSCPACGAEWVYGHDDTHKTSCKLAPLIGKV